MLVYKFGGASISSAEKMAALVPILKDAEPPLVIVISALGKTTNALEGIVFLAANNQIHEALHLMKALEKTHLDYARRLLKNDYYSAFNKLITPYFKSLEESIMLAHAMPLDAAYDKIVSMGELFSSLIFSFCMHQHKIHNEWLDIRPVLRTDTTNREAGVLWDVTHRNVHNSMEQFLKAGISIVTQGFIGSTVSGDPVTLGREGSDYTAAILATMLEADSVTLWKDVPGLLNADPRYYHNAIPIPEISYNEITEMAFYGAQVIHPKTLKPLHNANIPLYVKCFTDHKLPGTKISDIQLPANFPPLIVYKHDQLLIQMTTRDFSFVNEDNLSKIYGVFHYMKIKVNMMQNAALSFVACIDNQKEKVKDLITALSEDYKVLANEDVKILTIRHPVPELVTELTAGHTILMKQETRKTVQFVMQ